MKIPLIFETQNLYLRKYSRLTNTNDESQVKKFRLATSQIIQIVLKFLWPTLTTGLQQAKHNIFRFRSCTNMQGWVLPVPEIVCHQSFCCKMACFRELDELDQKLQIDKHHDHEEIKMEINPFSILLFSLLFCNPLFQTINRSQVVLFSFLFFSSFPLKTF